MATELTQLIDAFEGLWPTSDAEDWDRVGLVSGSKRQNIARVLLSVDVCSEVIGEAIDGSFDLILAHHPLLLRGVNSVNQETGKGNLLSRAIQQSIAIYSAHTNADIADPGVSSTLASALGLLDAKPLVPSRVGLGIGRVGLLSEPVSLLEFARLVASVLPATATGVRVAGDHDRLIQRVALCAGAGDAYLETAADLNADVYVTSDLRHHVVQDQLERNIALGAGPAIIDVSHWAAEWLWLDQAAEQLSSLFPNIQFVVSAIRTDPWDFVVTQ